MEGNSARSLFSPSNIRNQAKKSDDPASDGEAADAGAATPEKYDPLPRPGDAYRVHGRRGHAPELTLHFVTRDYGYEGFSYADLRQMRLVPGDRPGSGPVLILRFDDTEVRLEGRQLPSLYNWIGLHRIPWVWEHPSPAEFADKNATLISRISISQVER
jgi:hypothetical protein